MSGQQLLCLDEDQLYVLTDRLFDYIQEKHGKKETKWIDKDEAEAILKRKKGTLQKLRDTGKIRFSAPPDSTIILYDRDSILEYLDKNAQNTF